MSRLEPLHILMNGCLNSAASYRVNVPSRLPSHESFSMTGDRETSRDVLLRIECNYVSGIGAFFPS